MPEKAFSVCIKDGVFIEPSCGIGIEYEFDDISNDEEVTIPADPAVRNFSFTVVDGNIYFRENSIMRKVELNATAENRVKGMIWMICAALLATM